MSAITRRDALRAVAFGLVGAPAVLRGRYRLFAQSNSQYSARAVRLVESSVVVDLLNQFQFQDFAERPPRSDQWLSQPGTFTAADAARYQGSGITVFALGAGAGDYENAILFHARWNGFLAGYVAEKIILGEGKQAWTLMLAHFDRESDWGLDICDQKLNEQGDCPGKTLHLTFPDALERMLKENGYKVEK